MLLALCDECQILQKTTPAIISVVAQILKAGAEAGDALFRMDLCREHWQVVQPGLVALKAQDVRLPVAPEEPAKTKAEKVSERAIEATVETIEKEAEEARAQPTPAPAPASGAFGRVSS